MYFWILYHSCNRFPYIPSSLTLSFHSNNLSSKLKFSHYLLFFSSFDHLRTNPIVELNQLTCATAFCAHVTPRWIFLLVAATHWELNDGTFFFFWLTAINTTGCTIMCGDTRLAQSAFNLCTSHLVCEQKIRNSLSSKHKLIKYECYILIYNLVSLLFQIGLYKLYRSMIYRWNLNTRQNSTKVFWLKG